MSFQDFGGSRAAASTASASSGGVPARAASHHTMGQGALNQISESLLQYQRNVGILDKIVHSLTGNHKNNSHAVNREELEMQYQAQVHVIEQLGNKVHTLIANQKKAEPNPTIKTTLIKLERDFDRVQQQAHALTGAVTRLRSSTSSQPQAATTPNGGSGDTASGTAYEQYQQQMQTQMQEDRLAEQMMREREDEIRQINRGMHQVNEIYKDLAHIVASQQEQVDAIETQMEDSRANAEAGLGQIEKANDKFGNGSNCVIS